MTLIFSEDFAINPQSNQSGGGGSKLKKTVVVEPDLKSLNMEIKVEEE